MIDPALFVACVVAAFLIGAHVGGMATKLCREAIIPDDIVQRAARILRADMDQSAWVTDDEVREAMRAAVLAERKACSEIVKSEIDFGCNWVSATVNLTLESILHRINARS